MGVPLPRAAVSGLGRSRTLLKSRLYVYTIRGLGLVLGVFALFFLLEGFRYLRGG